MSALGVSRSAAEVAAAVMKGSDAGKNSFDNRRGRRSGGEEVGRCGFDGGLGGPRAGRAGRAGRAESRGAGGGAGAAATGSTVGRMAE